jgi:hypothetical protein
VVLEEEMAKKEVEEGLLQEAFVPSYRAPISLVPKQK